MEYISKFVKTILTLIPQKVPGEGAKIFIGCSRKVFLNPVPTLNRQWSGAKSIFEYMYTIIKSITNICILFSSGCTAWKVSVFGIFLFRIQNECGKIQNRKSPNTNTFHAVWVSRYWSSKYFRIKNKPLYKLNPSSK